MKRPTGLTEERLNPLIGKMRGGITVQKEK
jgi:hypothetical protein